MSNNNDNLFQLLLLLHLVSLVSSDVSVRVDDELSRYGCHLVLFILVDIGDHRSILLHLLNNEKAERARLVIVFLKEQIFISANKQNTFISRANLFFSSR